MFTSTTLVHWFLGLLLVLSGIGVVSLRKPIYASLSFLGTLLLLALFYLMLSAEFIAVMQILVYAGAILVIFVFVIVLFQDAHQQIERYPAKSPSLYLFTAAIAFAGGFSLVGVQFMDLTSFYHPLSEGFGQAEEIGKTLYLNFFFPFEAVILVFLVAIVGAIYTARKEQ